MKRLLLSTLCIILGLATCQQAKKELAEGSNDAYILSITNASDLDREHETILLHRKNLVEIFGELPEGQIPHIQSQADEWLPSQADDLDKDGQWDEVAFTLKIPAKSTKNLELVFKPSTEAVAFPPKANVRLGEKMSKEDTAYQDLAQTVRKPGHTKAKPTAMYQMEGPGWENDKVGFRLYFDPRNGIDIFGKTTDELVMDNKVGIVGDYHKLQDWGMDILKVGNSLGAGALAISHNGTLHRLSGAENVTFEVLAEGPARAVFKLHYENWPVGDDTLQLTQQISIWAGQYCYKNEVSFEGMPEGAKVVTGIVNLQSDSMQQVAANGIKGISTYDAQAYGGEQLGMAVLADEGSVLSMEQAPEEGEGIIETFYVELQPAKPTVYRFFAAWELSDERFATQEGFREFIMQETKRLGQPVKVSKAELAL